MAKEIKKFHIGGLNIKGSVKVAQGNLPTLQLEAHGGGVHLRNEAKRKIAAELPGYRVHWREERISAAAFVRPPA